MRIFFILLSSTLLMGCAIDPKALSGASAGASSVLGFYTGSADLRQQLAQETIKESAQLEYLSGNASTCRDNPNFTLGKDYYATRNIKNETIAKFEKTDADYIFLEKYSSAYDGIVKKSANAADDIKNYVSIIKSAGKYSKETAALSEIASLLGDAALAINEEVKFIKLRKAAKIYQPQLEQHAKSLAGRLSGLDRQTILDISVWRDCVQEKYLLITKLAKTNSYPTSIVELDTAYGTFQAQYRSYVGTSPQVGDMLTNLVEANKAMSKAPDSTAMRESIERYLSIFDNSRAAITRAAAIQI